MARSYVLIIALSLFCAPAVLSKYISSRVPNPSAESMFFELYTKRNNVTAQILRLGDVAALRGSNYDVTLPTKIYVHGWTSSAAAGYPTRDEMLIKYDCNYISTDWSELASGANYPFVVRDNVSVAGQHFGQFIDFLLQEPGNSIERFHVFGHSLGAHVSGEAGETVFGLRGVKLPRITGIDPAGPWFSLNDTDNRLDISDANFVDVIHTDGGTLTGNELGMLDPIGHIDFYPNGGTNQAGCHIIPPFDNEKNACDHERAPRFFAESVTTPVGFRAVECDSWDNFKAGLCTNNHAEMMGEPCPTTAKQGIYYLATNGQSPYAKG